MGRRLCCEKQPLRAARPCRLVKSHAAAPAAWRYSPQSFAPHLLSATSPLIAALGSNSGDCASSLTPSSPRNSLQCSSKTRRIVLRFRICMGGVPLTRSPREIADSETPHWSDNLRADHFSNARAARICAPLIGGLESKFPAMRLFLAVKPYAVAPATLRCSPRSAVPPRV